MAKGFKECKVCGKMYECCTTERSTDIYRWQDVACSPEHGAIYFAKIAESRGTVLPESVAKYLPKSEPVVEPDIEPLDDMDDNEGEEEDEDEDLD